MGRTVGILPGCIRILRAVCPRLCVLRGISPCRRHALPRSAVLRRRIGVMILLIVHTVFSFLLLARNRAELSFCLLVTKGLQEHI